MFCPVCGTKNLEGALFCMNCGARLALVCMHCGAALPKEARFCPVCGAKVIAPTVPMPPPPPETGSLVERLQRLVPKEFAERLMATRGKLEHERRQITLLFSDVKGSTAIAERLDPEEVMEIMDGAFDVLIEPVYRHEGTLARLMGDAILAFFGAPISHEDDAERAVRAALDILEGVQGYAARLEREWGIHGFNVRVGIHTGLVVVGEVGSDLRVEYTAMGDATNLAARLEQNAPVGGVLISQETYQQVRGLFEVEAQAPLEVKGRTQPVQTYRVLRALPRAFHRAARGLQGLQTRMVGRQAELDGLQEAFQRTVRQGGCRFITLVGDAGVGKSRLLLEFENWLVGQAAPKAGAITCLRGRAFPMGQHTPYGVWRDLFSERFAILESDGAAAVRENFEAGMAPYLPPEQAHLVGHLLGFDFSSTQAVQNLAGSNSLAPMALAYLTKYLRALAADTPLLVLLEDLHWADDASLDFCEHLLTIHASVKRLSEPLLVIGLARPNLYERRPQWGESKAFVRQNLQPLSPADCRALVNEILRQVADLPDELGALIVSSAEGNPFYVEELILMLMGDGVIVADGEAWRVEMERLKAVRVPGTLVGVLQARLDSLPDDEKEILQRAAVVGRRFWDAAVEWLEDAQAAEEPGGSLGKLAEKQLVFPQRRPAFAHTREYLFKHALLRDVTYETVLLKLRRIYHRRVAEWLEAHCGERQNEYAGLIAEHYELGRETGKAAEWLRRAGEAALGISAFREALATLERALALTPQEDVAGRARLLYQIGTALDRLCDYPQARERLQESSELARQAGEWATLANALTRLAWVHIVRGEIDQAKRIAEEALAIARRCGDPVVLARALIRNSDFLEDEADVQRTLEEALRLCEQTSDRQATASALMNLGIFHSHIKDFTPAECYYEQSLAIYRQINDRWGIANCLANLGSLFAGKDDFAIAIRNTEEALGIAREIGDREGPAIWLTNLGEIAAAQGNDEQAMDYLRQALGEAHAVGIVWVSLISLASMAGVFARRGEYRRAAELLGLGQFHPGKEDSWEETAAPAFDLLRANLPQDELQAALERGKALDLHDTVKELLYEPF